MQRPRLICGLVVLASAMFPIGVLETLGGQTVSAQTVSTRAVSTRAVSTQTNSKQTDSTQKADAASEEASKASEKAVPELSLESIYHPEEKFNYFTSVPSTHWLEDQLLVRRDDGWNELDLETFEEKPWPLVDRLAEQILQLDGVDEKRARRAAIASVTRMKTADDSVLVRIDKSLAIVSADRPARWLSRDASAWRDATLDQSGNRLAYTKNGDLFLVAVGLDRSFQLTDDASPTLLDGILDWTYQEEIYGRGNFRGFWFSPDGMWLAMLRIDTSGIEPYTLADARGERGTGIVARYPKAGDPIPHAELLLWDLRGIEDGNAPASVSLAKSTPREPRIITGVWWNTSKTQLLFSVSDRLQRWREVRMLDVDSLAAVSSESPAKLLFREESPTWVEPPEAPRFLPDGSFVWRSELPSGRTRLYHVSAERRMVTPLTPADFDVRDFFARESGLIVTGDADTNTIEQHGYQFRWRPEATSAKLTPITSEPGWHSLQPSPNLEWVVDRFSTPTQPTQLWLRSVEGDRTHRIAQSESKLKSPMVEPEVFHIATDDGASLPAMLIRPPQVSSQRPCPVVIEVYGGPSAPIVTKRFPGSRGLYRELLARQGVATLLVDNRSSAGDGLGDTWTIYERVGEQEFADVMQAVDWLRDQPWVDDTRLAIRGWSFGGFLTLYSMTHSDAFAAGVAGGSVTDWSEYDAFYTERYMGLPAENPDGYRDTAPLNHAEDLKGRVLLIHGESDDNVHPANTLRMAAELQKAGKEFELMIYPGAAHGVREARQVWHLNLTIHRFLQRTLEIGEN